MRVEKVARVLDRVHEGLDFCYRAEKLNRCSEKCEIPVIWWKKTLLLLFKKVPSYPSRPMAPSGTPALCAPTESSIPSRTFSSGFVQYCQSLCVLRVGAGWAPLNAAINGLKKERNARVCKSSFTRVTVRQLEFLSDCKDVAVSCVIIDPTYNHEREGRGNFVQEGKSGELASPPSLTQQTLVWVAACQLPRQQQR